MSGTISKSYDKKINLFIKQMKQEMPKLATRQSSQKTLEIINQVIGNTIGGSADLTGSNLTKTSKMKTVSPKKVYGDYIHYGIREHAMGSIMNGIALHKGFIPYGGTFLVFSDYMRSAIRLSAIQRLHVLYEFTHDSIFVGEDGPTHQPVEQAMSLRQIPHLFVHRPADAIETYFCSQLIMKEKDNPHAILLTRQKLPHIDMNSEKIKEGVERGAYIVKDVQSPDAIIFTSGSELHLALKVADKINKNIRVVNIPCWEIFHNQNNEYKERILLTNCKKRISIEAGSTHGWEKFTGIEGLNIGIDDFGHSAPGTDVAKKLGLEYEQCPTGNIVIRKPAGAGYEGAPSVCIQAHLDMVDSSDEPFDFVNNPIDAYIDGEWLKARGTTLGGDDGSGNDIRIFIINHLLCVMCCLSCIVFTFYVNYFLCKHKW